MRFNWLSLRLRPLAQVPRTPVCDTITGRFAIVNTSSMVAGEACARSTIILRCSMARSHCLPSGVRPPFFKPCWEPDSSVSKKCVGAAMR